MMMNSWMKINFKISVKNRNRHTCNEIYYSDSLLVNCYEKKVLI
jgi:hypothetical protein